MPEKPRTVTPKARSVAGEKAAIPMGDAPLPSLPLLLLPLVPPVELVALPPVVLFPLAVLLEPVVVLPLSVALPPARAEGRN